MDFVRQDAVRWCRDVPGARWFKADLHTHTIDDHPGGRAKLPAGLNGPPGSEEMIGAYARRFLQGAVRQGVRVLGVTPHSPRVGDGPETSAVWRIVEEWNGGIDDDGEPFRDKLFAVFPGFEPSFKQGREGLHLLFLFDPEIGCDRYLRAFDLAMGGASPWRGNELQLSNRNAEEAFRGLREFHRRESLGTRDGEPQWSYIVLAPHIESPKGLLGAQKAQVLELFQHGEVAGLELGDEKLPEDTVKNRPWLPKGMEEFRQAFFHGSDAYSVDDLGKRHTWLKLASPRIEALRQAFIANDSRMRSAYERDADGGLIEIPDPPDVTVSSRAWLRSVTITGGASFFRADDRGESGRFDLSPDLTCIIGGSMTGKSTFLDGLRVHVEAPLPPDDGLRSQVEARGKDGFLAGSPTVTLDCPGQDPTAPHHQRWPAVFHAQNELQRLAQEPEAVEDILARLAAPEETHHIRAREERLRALDGELDRAAKRLAKLDEDLADAEQACERSRKAAGDLAAISDAGIEDLHLASRGLCRWQEFADAAKALAADLDRIRTSAESLELPESGDRSTDLLRLSRTDDQADGLRVRWRGICDLLRSASSELGSASGAADSVVGALTAYEVGVRERVDRGLAARGLDGARIKEFQALNRQASLLASYEANLGQISRRLADAEREFQTLLTDRQALVDEQRDAFDRVTETVRTALGGRISARRLDHGDHGPLERFLREWKRKGITRWWNDLEPGQRPAPAELLHKMDAGRLAEVGMSDAVQATFRECLSASRRRELLAAVRCRDRYLIELGMDDGSRRRLDDLSGGQRVSVLLSLLLETNDDRPLVIDQPEDELDNRFLFETVLPALKRLKGRRQIVVATHNPNIVVNGDADQVIQLEATANRGRIAQAGAIEEPAVRDAIVRTVDGGDEAFRLRRLKYGF